MIVVSSGSTGFAVLRREANEGGFFRPIVKEVVEISFDGGFNYRDDYEINIKFQS